MTFFHVLSRGELCLEDLGRVSAAGLSRISGLRLPSPGLSAPPSAGPAAPSSGRFSKAGSPNSTCSPPSPPGSAVDRSLRLWVTASRSRRRRCRCASASRCRRLLQPLSRSPSRCRLSLALALPPSPEPLATLCCPPCPLVL